MCREKNVMNKIKIGKRVFISSFILVLMMAIPAHSVEPNLTAPAVNMSNEAEDFDVARNLTAISEDDRIPFIAFEKDSTIKAALRVLATTYDKNIVPSAKVDGVLGFTKLRNVTFEEALDAILGADFAYEQDGNLIKVYTREEYKKIKEDPQRRIYRIFTLYYITADEAAKLIKPVLSESAEIEKSAAAEKEISGGSGSGIGSSASSGGGGDSMALHDTIIIYDFPENIEKVERVLKDLDVRPKQVLVEATILSATLTEGMELGVDWTAVASGTSLIGTAATQDIASGDSISRGATATTPMQQIAGGVGGTPLEVAGFAKTGSNGLRLGITSGNVSVFITALERVTDVTILANPKILAVNKQEGYLQIGKKLGYRGSTTIAQGGIATQGEVEFLDTGTVLTFRPYIGNDGYIRMDIYPKDSTGQLNVDKVPDETTAEVKTNVLVRNGQTIVIGGLFRDVVTTTRNQVPLLGNLPILGAAFRGTTDITERQEVIVLITPHIIEEPGQTEGEARSEDVRRKRFGAKSGMQPVTRSKLAEDCYADAARLYIEGDNESAMQKVRIALTLRPTYLEAIRLKERILAETDPDKAETLERIILEDIDRQEAPNWLRK